MDFIKKLPSFSKFNTILVIVNQLTKQAIFISVHDTIMSMDLVYLFILHVFSKHSIPFHIISDRYSEFVLNFFCSLDTALNIQLHFTSGYHHKSDGQTKYTNQTLEQYFYIYYNYQQDNWSRLLPLAEFSYNNTLSATTGIFLFFAHKEYHLNITVCPECNIASSRAYNFAINLLYAKFTHLKNTSLWYIPCQQLIQIKLIFYGSHLTCNTPHSNNVIIQVFCLL